MYLALFASKFLALLTVLQHVVVVTHVETVAAMAAITVVAMLAAMAVATDAVTVVACSMAGSVTCCPAFVAWFPSAVAAVVIPVAAAVAIQVVQPRLQHLVAVATS